MDDYYQLARKGSLTKGHLEKFLETSTIDETPEEGFTLLVEAARNGQHSIVRLLLDNGANVNQRGSHNRAPLHYAVNAKRDRELTVSAILHYSPNLEVVDDGGNTPLIVAVKERSNLPVVRRLMAHGASTMTKNQKEESARSIATKSTDYQLRSVVLPKEYPTSGIMQVITKILEFLFFILAYINSGILDVTTGLIFKIYGIAGNRKPDRKFAEDIDKPTTDEEFKENIAKFVEDNPELSVFFKPGNDFFQRVAERALKLQDDEENHLKAPDQIRDLTRIALYQPILYCDDSGSMAKKDLGSILSRHELLKRLVTRISDIATRAVPDGSGTHLRFINKVLSEPQAFDNLNKDQIHDALNFEPSGGTRIGTALRNKILKPFVFDVFERGDRLKRPILIIVITDGIPWKENKDTLKNAILDCAQALRDNGYQPEAIRFLISRVGNDAGAADFIKKLGDDVDMPRVVHCTSDSLDLKMMEFHQNEQYIEEWLLNVLLSPIVGISRD